MYFQNLRLFSDSRLVIVVKCQSVEARDWLEVAVLNKPLNLFSNIQNKGIPVHDILTELQNSNY